MYLVGLPLDAAEKQLKRSKKEDIEWISEDPTHNGVKRRKRTSRDAAIILESHYAKCPLPSKVERATLAKTLGWTERQIQVWFQNKRQKEKQRRNKQEHKLETKAVPLHSCNLENRVNTSTSKEPSQVISKSPARKPSSTVNTTTSELKENLMTTERKDSSLSAPATPAPGCKPLIALPSLRNALPTHIPYVICPFPGPGLQSQTPVLLSTASTIQPTVVSGTSSTAPLGENTRPPPSAQTVSVAAPPVNLPTLAGLGSTMTAANGIYLLPANSIIVSHEDVMNALKNGISATASALMAARNASNQVPLKKHASTTATAPPEVTQPADTKLNTGGKIVQQSSRPVLKENNVLSNVAAEDRSRRLSLAAAATKTASLKRARSDENAGCAPARKKSRSPSSSPTCKQIDAVPEHKHAPSANATIETPIADEGIERKSHSSEPVPPEPHEELIELDFLPDIELPVDPMKSSLGRPKQVQDANAELDVGHGIMATPTDTLDFFSDIHLDLNTEAIDQFVCGADRLSSDPVFDAFDDLALLFSDNGPNDLLNDEILPTSVSDALHSLADVDLPGHDPFAFERRVAFNNDIVMSDPTLALPSMDIGVSSCADIPSSPLELRRNTIFNDDLLDWDWTTLGSTADPSPVSMDNVPSSPPLQSASPILKVTEDDGINLNGTQQMNDLSAFDDILNLL
ncbi:hypothetical protein HDU85_003474 [Gaertneriomyces sp. JEL0708]|nr:hypothetical protein HDU85_003474 [Gaertneriomyces sp. JEL0708]